MAKANVLKFGQGTPGDFHHTVDERVKAYFKKHDLDIYGNQSLYIKAAILFSAFILAYLCILSSALFAPYWHPIITFIWVMTWYAALGYIIPGLGFNVMHDAVHGSFSDNKKLNAIIAFWSGDAMGASTFAWRMKHNILHHTNTNVDGNDDDIVQYPTFRFNTHQPWLPHHKYQHLYARVLYCLLSLSWSLINDYKKVAIRGKVLQRALNAKKKDYIRFALGKIVNLAIFTLPAFFLPHWWYALIGFVVTHAFSGYTLSIVFQMAHVVEGPTFTADPVNAKIEMTTREHQMHTTANFDRHNKALTWYVGGLNYQIEHHLFPGISHVHYPAISGIVEDTANEFDVPYNVFPTFGDAKRSHFRYLKQMGINPLQLGAHAA